LTSIFSFRISWPVLISASRCAIICSTSVVWGITVNSQCNVQSDHFWHQIVTCKGFAWLMSSGLDDWIYWHPIHTTREYRQYSTIADLQTLQFTVTHALGFSESTSRMLETDLQQSPCQFKSHMKSSLHRLIPFLHFFSIAFDCHL
jgi:hypothetical protein